MAAADHPPDAWCAPDARVGAGRASEGRTVSLQAVPRDVASSPLGRLGPLLADDDVSEVMVNACGEVWVERVGRLERSAVRFDDAADVRHLIERVVSPLGLRIDLRSPWVDARLPDGSRFHAVVPPIALGGPVVTIRKFGRARWMLHDLVATDALSDAHAVRLSDAVAAKQNVLVCGGGGAGKTTLLGVLCRLTDPSERIVTIEDSAELQLGDRHVVALETRPPNVDGRGEVTMRDLVRCAMRMRADRIVVGEVRGAEALDMIQALTSGHGGSFATVHADSPAQALMRLEVMALLAAPGLSAAATRRQVASAIDVIAHVVRTHDGTRRVASVVDVHAGDDGAVLEVVPTTGDARSATSSGSGGA